MGNNQTSRTGSSRKWWALLILLVVAILFAVTTPDKQAHCEALSQKVSTAVNNSIAGKNPALSALSNIVVSRVVDAAIESNVDVSNYLVCSVATAQWDGKSNVLSVGVLGHVFVLFKSEQLQEIIQSKVNDSLQSAGGLIGIGRQLLGMDENAQAEEQAAKEQALPDSTSPGSSPIEDAINRQIDKISKKAEKAVEQGVKDAVNGFIKGMLGNED